MANRLSKRNWHRCKACKRAFNITPKDVTREWKTRGYDGDYKTYYIKCPACHHKDETTLFKLPFDIMLRFIRSKFGIES